VYAAMFMAGAAAAAPGGTSPPARAAPRPPVVAPRRPRPRGRALSRRLAEALSFARGLEGDWEARVDALYERYGHYHWVHAINNTALVAAALYAFDDFSAAVC